MKKMVQRILCVLCILGAASVAWASGAQEEIQTDGPVELNVIEGPGHAPFLVERFQDLAEEQGINVNLNVIPYGRDANVKLVAFVHGRR